MIAEIMATASSNSINPEFAHLEPDGEGLRIAIEKAILLAGIDKNQIDLIIPTGTGIPQDDRSEANALKAVFGSALETIHVWPIKSMVTHTGAAAGAIDMIAAVKALDQNTIGPAINCRQAKETYGLNIAVEKTVKPIRYVLCCGYSFGGQTAAIILKKYEEDNQS